MYELDLDELEIVSGGYTPGLFYGMSGGHFGIIYGSNGNFPQSNSQPYIQYDTSFMNSGGSWSGGHFETNYGANSITAGLSDYPYLSSYIQSHTPGFLSANQPPDLHVNPEIYKEAAEFQSKLCQTDPFWASIISSNSFNVNSDIIVSATKSTNSEHAKNNYSIFGNTFYGDKYTDYLPNQVILRWADNNPLINFVMHTHTQNSEPGLSNADMSHNFPIMAIQVDRSGSVTGTYCFTP